MSTGMIIDGVFASQAVDSSGEVLDVAGCDISTLDIDGVANYEHKEGDKKDGKGGNNGEEIVGKIIYAKKIFRASDCEGEREEDYWRRIRVPFIYGMVRLYDGAGHSGAQALAAQIRDHHANNEPILVRYSIEGSTLDRDEHDRLRLKESVARRVALTLKPCNRTAISGLIEDPRAPDGFDKKPATETETHDLLAGLVEKGERLEHPAYTKLGGVHEVECNPLLSDDVMGKLRLIAKAQLLKALTAGSYGAAPGSLEGGAALQREHIRSRLKRAVAEYKPKGVAFDKGEFKAFAKTYLPEADDAYLDHFADVAGDYHAKRNAMKKAMELEEDRLVQPQEGLGWAEPEKPKAPPKNVAPVKTKGGKKKLPAEALQPPTGLAARRGQAPNPTAPGEALGGGNKRLGMTPEGDLIMPSGQKLPLHIPSGPEYLSILQPDLHDISDEKRALYARTVHEPWERAMANWMVVNKAAREKRLPRSILKMAGLFAAMSPNTGVPLQERHYGHIMDMLHEGLMDINKPVEEHHLTEFSRRAQGFLMPSWNREHYEEHGPPPQVSNQEDVDRRNAKPNKWGNEKAELPQINGFRHLDDIMPHLEHLFATHGADGQKMVEELMNMKAAYKRKAVEGAEAAKQSFAGKHPVVEGFGPKLTRYMLSMAGAGNVIVPDRHMTRSLYNVGQEDPTAEWLATRFVTQAKNEPYLRQLDQHFYNKHPAVKYVLNKYPEHFKGHEDQALFPAFWLHWLHIPHYERNQGRETAPSESITGTDHKVFWDSVQDAMRRHAIPIQGHHYSYTPPDTSFDFGENVAKAEPPHPMGHLPLHARALGAMWDIEMKHGEQGALAAYYAHIVPALMDEERHQPRRDPHALIRKYEGLTIDLLKAAADVRAARERKPAPVAEMEPRRVTFAGNPVLPGRAVTAEGAYDLFHEDQTHYTGVPEGTPPEQFVDKLVRLPKAKEGTHFTVHQHPSVLVSDLG